MAAKMQSPLTSMSDKTIQNLVTKPMTQPQKKALLKQLQTPDTISSLRRPEILMDFFTDCLSTSDLSLAVPALSGLFHLITLRNLDYPAFYPRLYALLDDNLLHSKYRSRILRHLDVFLSPTNHLPAATVASFIKRLSRLCLYAPPAAIVAILPFIYNLLKAFPATTFMIHRLPYPPYVKQQRPPATTTGIKDAKTETNLPKVGEEEQLHLGVDPYNPTEPDPQFSHAIDSSLWELETLQSHYHPTVASICRIISEQFTKQQYQLEDFLDHGYGTLVDAELKRDGKKAPVVEWKIPRRVLTGGGQDGNAGAEGEVSLVEEIWLF